MSSYSRELRNRFTPILTTTKQALVKKQVVVKKVETQVISRRSLSVKSLRPSSKKRQKTQLIQKHFEGDYEEVIFNRKYKKYNIFPANILEQPVTGIKCIGSITNKGMFKKTNQDRISIIPNIKFNQTWVGIYDGHGGSECVDFIQKQLPNAYLQQNKSITQSLSNCIMKVQNLFMKKAEQNNNTSGSCALILVINNKDDQITIANVGDSRMITSQHKGQTVIQNTQDHKPSKFTQRERIIKNGGQVYESKSTKQIIFRLLPGKLSVSRTIGDIQAKLIKYKGNPNVLIATPQLFNLDIKQFTDFVLIATDGLFDVLNNQQIVQIIHKVMKSSNNHSQCIKKCLQTLLIQAFQSQSTDNISIVIVTFDPKPKPNISPHFQQLKPSRTLSLKDFRALSKTSHKRLQVLKQKTHLKK